MKENTSLKTWHSKERFTRFWSTVTNPSMFKDCNSFEWHTELFLVVFPCNNHSIFVAEIRAKTQLVTHDLTCMAAQTTRYDRWTKKEENRYWKPKKSWYYNSMTGFWGNDKSSMMHHKWVGYKILNTVKIIVFLFQSWTFSCWVLTWYFQSTDTLLFTSTLLEFNSFSKRADICIPKMGSFFAKS